MFYNSRSKFVLEIRNRFFQPFHVGRSLTRGAAFLKDPRREGMGLANISVSLAVFFFLKRAIAYICYSPAGSKVRIGKNCARGLETEGTVFPNTHRPRPVNNIFIYF